MSRRTISGALTWAIALVVGTPRQRAHRQFLADNGENLRYAYQLKPESKIFDVGAFKGEFSKEMLRKFGSNIWAFEPHPEFCKQLNENFRGESRVRVLNYGLGSRTEYLRLSNDSNSSSFVAKEKKNQSYVSGRVLDIAEFLHDSNLGDIDLIKLNVEGMEFDIVSRLIDSGLIAKFRYLQIQWHPLSKSAAAERNALVDELRKTHSLDWKYDWVWESWSRNPR